MSIVTSEVSPPTVTIFSKTVSFFYKHHFDDDLVALVARYSKLVQHVERNEEWPWKGNWDDFLAGIGTKSNLKDETERFRDFPGRGRSRRANPRTQRAEPKSSEYTPAR